MKAKNSKGQFAPVDVRVRFMEYIEPVTESGCWIWTGPMMPSGYGRLSIGSKNHGAHRLSYLFFRGEIAEGLSVCHHCDVPSCVNPAHLFLGTTQENTADKIRKGRNAKGCRVHNKLTDEDVHAIRSATGGHGFKQKLARQYGVTGTMISLIRSRKSWKHI
jgi:hypothetical protein